MFIFKKELLFLRICTLFFLSFFVAVTVYAVDKSYLGKPQALVVDKTAEEFIFGMLLVGPYNDHGWSQSHFEAGKYLQSNIPLSKFLYIDKVNPADRPGITVVQLVDDLVEKGAEFIIANSDDMKDGIREAAEKYSDVKFVHVSGDDVLTGKSPENLSNLMGKMEYCKMMAGFCAALTTKTGKVGYLGPLVNDETRRLAVSCYLGAKYGWEKVLHKDPDDLKFNVTWIGYWFNIPGVTADPIQVVHNFYSNGFDVVISGIDTTEALAVANRKRLEGKEVWALPYDYSGACSEAPKACLGVPYFNWVPGYTRLIKMAMAGKWKPSWLWLGPDWENINNISTSSVGFLTGDAMPHYVRGPLNKFIKDLGEKKINLFKGPLYYQDKTVFLKDGEIATDKKIWYLKQLLSGMKGQNSR